MAVLATVAGHHADAGMYSNAAAAGRVQFERYFWNGVLETYAGPDGNALFVQLYSVLGLALGLDGGVPVGAADHRGAALKTLLNDISARGGKHTVGLMGWQYLFRVLSNEGQLNTAMQLVTSAELPSLGYMLAGT